MDETKPAQTQSKLLIAWALSAALIAVLFFAHPARHAYMQRVGKFMEHFSGKR